MTCPDAGEDWSSDDMGVHGESEAVHVDLQLHSVLDSIIHTDIILLQHTHQLIVCVNLTPEVKYLWLRFIPFQI